MTGIQLRDRWRSGDPATLDQLGVSRRGEAVAALAVCSKELHGLPRVGWVRGPRASDGAALFTGPSPLELSIRDRLRVQIYF